MQYVVLVGMPLAIGLIGSLVILDQKGYFNFFGRSGKPIPRQDASAFADFSREASKEVWKGAPPTAEFDRIAARLAEAQTNHPQLDSDVKALRKRLSNARSRNGSGALSNNDALAALQEIDADLRKLLRKVEPVATSDAAAPAAGAAAERSVVEDDPTEFNSPARSPASE